MNDDLLLYHGTAWPFQIIDLSRSRDKRDFGRGFYTTELQAQAREWAHNIRLRNPNTAEGEYVHIYRFAPDDKLSIKRFDGITPEWLELITLHRSKGGLHHAYDVVIGPVANDNTFLTINRYMDGIYTEAEAMERLRHSRPNNQVSFHTEKALKSVVYVRSDERGW